MVTYLQDINATALLDARQEKELARRVREGDPAARHRMVRANLRLVVKIARAYTGKGLSLEDLIEDGNLGLLQAVERFDPGRGTRFGTCAYYWIKESINQGLINAARTIRFPAYVVRLLARWRHARARLRDELGRAPAEEEVARELQLPGNQLGIIQKALRVCDAAVPEDAEAGTPLSELAVADEPAPGAGLSGAEERARLLALLDRMPVRDSTVLCLRFGLSGAEPMTLNQIGQRLGLTRERVRQIVSDCLQQLREQLEAA